MEIQPQHISLDKLFYRRLFRIPQYQRAYSWQRLHREDLFGDVRRTSAAGNESSHFMSTVVGLRRGKRTIITDEYQVIEVVDGQQRLTTLILLLKAVARAIDRSDAAGEKSGRDLDETLVKSDEASLLLLQTNHDSSHYFADYLRTGNHPPSASAKTLADRELLLAIEDCERFVTIWKRDALLTDLISLLKNRLTFIFYEIDDESVVYTVFEVLNSRGLEVSWFDRLKSMLMETVFSTDSGNRDEIIDEVHQLWGNIYSCVGLRLGMSTESLRFAATLRAGLWTSRPLSEEQAAKLLRDRSKGGPAKVIETTKWLKAVTEAVDRLSADHRRNAVTGIAQARLLACAVDLRTDLSASERREILRHWESVTFRIYGMFRKDARTAVGDYVRLACRTVRDKLPAQKILEGLATVGSSFPVDQATENLRGEDCYSGWQEELRYFLYRYEEYLAHRAGQNFDNEQWNRIWESNAADSIEHIMPQSYGLSIVHNLGNLVLLPPKLNSKLGARAPKEKASEYTKTGLLIAQEVAQKLETWSYDAIKEREEELLKWAQEQWAD